MKRPLLFSLAGLALAGAASAQQNPSYFQYQFNEPRGALVANTGGLAGTHPFATVATDAWQASAPFAFGPGEPGVGVLGQDDTQPYDNRVDTGWPLNVSGSFTISWRQRMVLTPGARLSYAWGTGTAGNFRCFTGGVANDKLIFRGTVLGDFSTNRSVQVPVWQTYFLVVDDNRRTMSWYVGRQRDNWAPYPPGVTSFSATDTTNLRIAWHLDPAAANTRFFEMDDFRFYGRALDQLGIDEEISNENPVGSTFDPGCARGLAPKIALVGRPNLDPTWWHGSTLQLRDLDPLKPALLVFGVSATRVHGVPILPLGLIGDCTWGTSGEIRTTFSTGNGNLDLILYTGGLPALSGTHVYAQAFIASAPLSVTPVLDVNLQFDM